MNIPTIEELRKMENFCPLPWVSLFTKFEGEILLCCVDYNEPVSYFYEKDCWNSDNLKQIRLNMLNNIYNDRCKFCINMQEKRNIKSLRLSSIDNYLNENIYNIIKQTNGEGYISSFPLVLDTKFSNLCNLKCLKCKDLDNGGNLQVNNDIIDKYFENNFDIIKSVNTIIIAGGEPFLMKQHKYFLELLIKNNLVNKQIEYFTNFTIDVEPYFNYWNNFKKISLICSLDEQYDRFEFIRFRGKWNNVINNKIKINEYINKYSNLTFKIQLTIDIYNIFNIPLTIKSWIDSKFVEPKNIFINILGGPKHLRFDILPKTYLIDCLNNFLELKQYNNELINEFIKTLQKTIKNQNFNKNDLDESINCIHNNFNEFKKINNCFDNIYGIFPEFKKFM